MDNHRNSIMSSYIWFIIVGSYIMLLFNMAGQLILAYFVIVTVVFSIYAIKYPQILESEQNRDERYERLRRRRLALKSAQLFLAPYRDVWRDLRLANKFCVLRLGRDGKTITGNEKKSAYGGECSYRSFKIVSTNLYSYEVLWNMFCLNFDHLTSYEGLLELTERFQATAVDAEANSAQNYGTSVHKKVESETQVEKIDVNNASEIELTALPGISIVLSKKIIKKRESIGGFKSLDDFFLYMKLKPHMETRLRKMLCVNKMSGTLQIERTNERNVDL